MRIVAINERTVRLTPAARSANVSFDDMTATALAVHTDVRRNGKALVGLAFDSIGRYDHGGLLRDRFMPRLMAAKPEQYADEAGGIDPFKAWTVMMTNEKPGGHGERCGAVGSRGEKSGRAALESSGEARPGRKRRRHGRRLCERRSLSPEP